MNRVIVTNNTKQNISTVFSDLQDNIELELAKLYADIFQEFGIVAETINGAIAPTDTSLKVVKTPGTLQLTVSAGHAITANGDILVVSEPGETFTVSGEGDHSLYLIPKTVYTEFVERVAGFQYGAETTTTPSRSSVDVDLTDVDPGTNGIWLADITVAADVIDTVTDKRSTNLLKINYDIYDELDVVRLNQDSNVLGTLTANVLGVNDSSGVGQLTISGELVDNLSVNVTPSGIVDAVNWAHDHTVSTFNPLLVTATADDVNNLMSYGIINYDDGFGDRIIKTEQIPSQPNTVGTITPTLYSYQQSSSFGQSLLNDLGLYRANRISMTARTEKRNSLSNLSSQITAWLVNNSGITWQEAWTSDTIVDAYGHTLSGLAGTIVDYGYATADEVGLNGPTIGTTVSDLITHVNNESALAESERASLSNTVQSSAENISIQAERLTAQPDLVRPKYRVKLTWDAPTLVDNEEIKKYVVKVYQVTDGSWAPPTETEMNTVEENIEGTLSVSQHETLHAQEILETVATIATDTITDSTHFVMANVTNIQVGDFVAPDGSATDKNKVIGIDGTSNTVIFIKAFATTPTPPTDLIFYRKTYEDTIAQRTHWITVDRDQTYIVYVRAVSEYDIYGEWSAGKTFTTNALTIDGVSLTTLMNSRDEILRQINQAQQVTLRADLEDTVAELSRQVSAQPDMVAITNLTAAYKSLQTQINEL